MESEWPEFGRIVTGFARVLRAHGLSVPMGMAILFAEALARLGVDRRDRVYWAGRATLVRRVEDIPVYDRAFAAFWQDRPEQIGLGVELAPPLTLALDDGEDTAEAEEDEGEAPAGDVLTVRYSPSEILRHQDMSALTAEEWVEAQRLISALGIAAELQLSRRTRPTRRRSRGHPDLRGTMRRSMRTGGIPIRRAWRSPQPRPRRLVLLLDVSGSMAPYARGLARFAHAAVGARRAGRVEVFTIGTRLTRITRELARRDPDAALASAADSVADWSGGTRLGASLAEFNDRWGVRGMARGAVVVILQRRVGPGRPGPDRIRDGSPVAGGPPGGVGQPPQGVPGVRPAGPRDGGGPSVC